MPLGSLNGGTNDVPDTRKVANYKRVAVATLEVLHKVVEIVLLLVAALAVHKLVNNSVNLDSVEDRIFVLSERIASMRVTLEAFQQDVLMLNETVASVTALNKSASLLYDGVLEVSDELHEWVSSYNISNFAKKTDLETLKLAPQGVSGPQATAKTTDSSHTMISVRSFREKTFPDSSAATYAILSVTVLGIGSSPTSKSCSVIAYFGTSSSGVFPSRAFVSAVTTTRVMTQVIVPLDQDEQFWFYCGESSSPPMFPGGGQCTVVVSGLFLQS